MAGAARCWAGGQRRRLAFVPEHSGRLGQRDGRLPARRSLVLHPCAASPPLPAPPLPPPPADIAAVSTGGRANGQWKPDNQDSFLVQPTASAAAASPAAPAAAAIGVFDGHGRLGRAASAIVRQAMADTLAAVGLEAAAAGGLQGAARLLDGCFSAADQALEASGRDFSKSGCTAVLALLDRDSVSVAWAGDSRAVLGVCDAGAMVQPPSAFGSASAASASFGSSGGSMSGASDSYDGFVTPLCAAVPLTEDHKPDK